MDTRPLVVVIDDDESVRESLPDLLRECGFAVRAFSSAEEFLASECIEHTRCLILDIVMPRMSGPDLQRELQQRRQETPVIFITADRNEALGKRLLKRGAVACLFKPISVGDLLTSIDIAVRGT
jgi:FixJ family two-component response regulator